jgi:hypothetical protein
MSQSGCPLLSNVYNQNTNFSGNGYFDCRGTESISVTMRT